MNIIFIIIFYLSKYKYIKIKMYILFKKIKINNIKKNIYIKY